MNETQNLPRNLLITDVDNLEQRIAASVKKAITDALAERFPAAQDETDELMTQQEACEFLKITVQTLINWRKKGMIKAHTIGGQVRYLKRDILDAVKGRG